MNEIEEIKERNKVKISNIFPTDPRYMKVLEDDISFLLSSLEKVLSDRNLCPECLGMLEPDGSCLTCRFRIALEKAQSVERVTQHPLFKAVNNTALSQSKTIRQLSFELEKEKEDNERLHWIYNLELERVNKAENKHFQALLELQKEKEQVDYFRIEVNALTVRLAYEEERVKWLYEGNNKLAVDFDNLQSRLKQLMEVVEKHKNHCFEEYWSSEDKILYKIVEEVKKIREER